MILKKAFPFKFIPKSMIFLNNKAAGGNEFFGVRVCVLVPPIFSDSNNIHKFHGICALNSWHS